MHLKRFLALKSRLDVPKTRMPRIAPQDDFDHIESALGVKKSVTLCIVQRGATDLALLDVIHRIGWPSMISFLSTPCLDLDEYHRSSLPCCDDIDLSQLAVVGAFEDDITAASQVLNR